MNYNEIITAILTPLKEERYVINSLMVLFSLAASAENSFWVSRS